MKIPLIALLICALSAFGGGDGARTGPAGTPASGLLFTHCQKTPEIPTSLRPSSRNLDELYTFFNRLRLGGRNDRVVVNSNASGVRPVSAPDPAPIPTAGFVPAPERKLHCRHTDMEGFFASVKSPRAYRTDGVMAAGVVPHHLTGAVLMSGFYEAASRSSSGYDAVVVVGPNHKGDIADVIISRRDWDVFGGVPCDADLATALLGADIPGVGIAENDDRMELEHSASVHIPYIGYYMPGTAVVPVLVSNTISHDGALWFASALANAVSESGKRVLLVCSIDFAHGVSPEEAARNDAATAETILARDYNKISGFSNTYTDSPAALILFIWYAENRGAAIQILDNADASEFIGADVPETTSYFVLAGIDK